MISCKEAHQLVLDQRWTPGKEVVGLDRAAGRYLAQPVEADRPLPPYNRATMDGIAILHEDFRKGVREFRSLGMARAGKTILRLTGGGNCIEIATGAVVPEGADTVVRYEDLTQSGDVFSINSEPEARQSIHPAGSDARTGETLLEAGTRIGPAEIAVLASIGVSMPEVYSLPAVTLISTGDELVDVNQVPEAHQIRKSNTWMLRAALIELGIEADEIHLVDEREKIRAALQLALGKPGVLMLSGGVSKGKFDFIPAVLEELGVRKSFHRVAQRPGKPFWFGVGNQGANCIFSFPGNPVSTFLNFHLYFRDWLMAGFGAKRRWRDARLSAPLINRSGLTQFRLATAHIRDGVVWAEEVPMNSSGDFLSLAKAEGFVRIEPSDTEYARGTPVEWLPFKTH